MSESKKGKPSFHVQSVPLYSLDAFQQWRSLFGALDCKLRLNFYADRTIVTGRNDTILSDINVSFSYIPNRIDNYWWELKIGDKNATCFVTGTNRMVKQTITFEYDRERNEFVCMVPKDLSQYPTRRILYLSDKEMFACLRMFFDDEAHFGPSVKIELNTSVVLKEIEIQENL